MNTLFAIKTPQPAGKVLITGATGTVGRKVCALLLDAGIEAVGATRRPTVAAGSGVPVKRWVGLDYEEPHSFGASLEGVERLFLIARPGDEDPAAVAGPFLRAARAAGVRRVVNLTALGAEQRDDVRLGEVERLVADHGFDYTHLRPNWFMQIFCQGALQAGIRTTDRLAVPAGDAGVSFVDARDVAAVAARCILEDGHEGRAYDLTGPEALSHAEVAGHIATAVGRPIEYQALDEDSARAAIRAAGLGPDRVERLVRFYRLVRDGYSAPVTRDVEAVLGRPAIPFVRFAEEHVAAWRRGPADASHSPDLRPVEEHSHE